MNQTDRRSKLQERVAAELRDEAASDGVEDTAYLEGTKQTTTLAWAWIVIAILAAVVVILFFLQGGRRA